MFEALKNKRRDALKASTAWFLFGAIILVFIFWGMNPQHEGFGQGGVAAYVNSQGIPMRQVFRLVENMRAQDPTGGEGDESSLKRLQAAAISQLVSQELIAQTADKSGIVVSDAEVRELLVKQPAFQENGQFRRELYMRYLQATGTSAAELEATIRRELLMQKIQRAFASALRPTEMESKKQRELAETKANLDFLAVGLGKGDVSNAPDTEVRALIAKEGARIKTYFDGHQAEFAQPEEVRARHILVKFEPGKTESESAALEKAKQIRARLEKKEDFAAIAKAESDDPGSKAKGGDLGFFGRGRMVPEFEKAAFEGTLKAVSEPIRTEYGYHLVEPLEKKAARPAELTDANKETIARKLVGEDRAARATAEFHELASKGDIAGLEASAKKWGLKWEETGAFAIDAPAVPKIGANDEIARAAFGLTAAKPVASNVYRQGTTAYVIRYRPVPAKAEKTAGAGKGGSKSPMAAPDFDNPDFMRELMATQKTRDSMGRWMKDLQKSAKVEYSPQLGQEQ